MRKTSRVILALGLVLGFSLVCLGAQDVESSPQAKVYRACEKAIKAGDYDAYSKCVTSTVLKDMAKQGKEMGKTTKDLMGLMQIMSPTDVKFTALKVDGKTATLSATGKMDATAMKGSIPLEDEGGQWKLGKQSWENAK